jgi:hypothetical protein
VVHVLHLHAYVLLPLCGGVALVLLALHRPSTQPAYWSAVAVAPAFAALQALVSVTGAQHAAVHTTAGQNLLLAAIARGLLEALLLCAPLTAAAAAACTQLCKTATRKPYSSMQLPSPGPQKKVVHR